MKYLIILFPLFLTLSCSSIPKTICPEDQYKNLNNIPIFLTTKNPVILKNPYNNKSIKSNGKLNSVFIEKYIIDSNSINADIPPYKAIINFHNIEEIKFDGIYLKETGFIARLELEEKMDYTGTVLSGLFGVAGFYAGLGITNLLFPIRFNDGSAAIVLLGGIVGSTISGILGYNIGFNSELNLAIERIKKERTLKLFQSKRFPNSIKPK